MRFIAKDFGIEKRRGKVIPQMALTHLLACFCTRKKSNLWLVFFCLGYIKLLSFVVRKRRKVEIGSFHACIFDGDIENAICIKSRGAPRVRVVCETGCM